MFRKLFTPEEKKEESSSSGSEASEIVTKADIPEIPRKRHFFRKPLLWNDPKPNLSTDTKPPNPYGNRLYLPRSKSFSFRQSGHKDQFLCLPRSKSVHFAENILTVRFVDPIPKKGQKPQRVDWKNVEVPNDSLESSNADSEDISSDTLQRVQATLGHIFCPDSPLNDAKAANCPAADEDGSTKTENEDNETDDSKSLDSEEDSEIPDSAEKRNTIADIELLYPIYQQTCELVQLDCISISKCNLNQIKADIRASLDDAVANITSTVKIMKGLQAQVRNYKSEVSAVNEENSELHNLLKEKDREALQLKEQLCTMRNRLTSQNEGTDRLAREKALKAENSELLQREESAKFELDQMKRKLDEIVEEKNRAAQKLQLQLQESGHRELSLQKKDTEMTQKLERERHENKSLRNELEIAKMKSNDQSSVENKSLKMQIAAQTSTITNMESKLKEENAKIDGLKQKYKQLLLSEKAKISELEKVQFSNRIAVDAFRKFIKSSFEALAPIFQPQSTQEYTQAYYGFSQTTIFDESHQSAIALICAFLLTTIRNLLAQHLRNEKALESEVENRLKYQQEVLSTFTKMTHRILQSQTGRVSLAPPKEHKKSWN